MPCSRRMLSCHSGCAHRDMIRSYREERERQETAAEDDWRERDGNENATPLITFKQWLEGLRHHE